MLHPVAGRGRRRRFRRERGAAASLLTEPVLTGLMLTVLIAAGLLLAGCGSSAGGSASGTRGLRIVASTDLYGNIAEQIAGSRASVASIIDSPDQDPHSYEASARNQLELARADLVIVNGGGYDDFVARMLRSAGKSPTTINVVDLSGRHPSANGQLNEHVWYDFPTVVKLAHSIRADLTAKDPEGAATFRRNTATFVANLKALEATEASIKAKHGGEGVAITEPVPLYLTQACGLVNKTPAAFSEAIEEGNDVPVRVLQQTLGLFTGKSVSVLVYNEQTAGPQTDQVLAAARKNGVPTVGVTETLPAGQSYLQWMRSNLHAIGSALD